ncbi:amidase [Mycobacterium montefiorense]|uniref:amidase n=1 Tax=Mycobacterium montefiorense TaxID=154654 RepID=UPI0021DEB32F|nr:amidase [Mycobacterium montefiorense]MCV7425619.1 amidase [Mycobacterium montefiorense]GLE51541.1 putative amidase AmiC [Mycobacterium montefiorense]
MNAVHAFCDDALGYHDAVGLVAALKSRQVSVPEVVEAAIARTEAVNPVLNGLSFQAFDRARERAATTGGERFLGGVPTFVKDCEAVAGMPTMAGCDAWKPRPAAADGEFASAYLATGMVPLGLTRMSEFGFNAATEHPRLGAVRNPWNPDCTAGGSSSGSAAFVAAGVVPIAHANDAGGSIRIPASCNGLVGFKPSRGRLPMDKQMRRLPIVLIENGVLTRSVRDTAAFYREAERLYRNQDLPGVGDVSAPGRARLRIAVCTRPSVGTCSTGVSELALKTAALLEELGHRVEQVDEPLVPASFADDFLLFCSYCACLVMTQVRVSRYVGGPAVDRRKLDNFTLGLARLGRRNLHRMPRVIDRLKGLRQRSAIFFGDYDAVLTPTLSRETPRIGYLDPTATFQQVIDRLTDFVAFLPQFNITGEPSISLPLAESVDGMPVGMMLAADIGQDARLLELAYELEEAQPWRQIQSA